MLILQGCRAFSDFRINQLFSTLQSQVPEIVSIQAHFIHFVDIKMALSAKEQNRLNTLLNYTTSSSNVPDSILAKLIVVPRAGTISPWSSKATDIIHHVGLDKIKRIERGIIYFFQLDKICTLNKSQIKQLKPLLHDRMTEQIILNNEDAHILFNTAEPTPLTQINILDGGVATLKATSIEMGLALSTEEIEYLYNVFKKIERNPTDVELMMFAQINSEHCRHKIFNADWVIDGKQQSLSLFKLIQQTHDDTYPGKILSAYHDNAAVMKGYTGNRFFTDSEKYQYAYHQEDIDILMKVETHNHPTAISPYPGAATGSGGEIRDEAATGQGAKPKAGLCGFAVSNLKIPNFEQPWERDNGKPDRIASALDIMIKAPIGSASYNNEFGRPALCGYFRSYEQRETDTVIRGYHKPIMLAGGYGSIRNAHLNKKDIPVGAKLIVLGGPAMLIGLGGGGASSMISGSSDELLDFASVQRDNAEMQRRCQDVIDHCWSLGDQNPILTIHDVGAGGLSNAIPELVSMSHRGAKLEIREIPNDEPNMSPIGIWCNESQERYVLAINPAHIKLFEHVCQRERAPYAIVGEAIEKEQLILNDSYFNNQVINMPMSVLLGKKPSITRDIKSEPILYDNDFNTIELDLNDVIDRLFHLPTIASKLFLITICDRSVSGLVVRDQMVGPWQVPVADCAVTASSYYDYIGEAMALGERTPIALSNAPASGRMAVAEAIMNICAARILNIDDIVLSANWMAACGESDQDAKLYATVSAVSQLCRELGITIPVGKDSLSMKTIWTEEQQQKQTIAPISLNISAFARVADVRQSLTPQLQQDDNTSLLFIDLANKQQRMGGSCLYQVYEQIGNTTPDLSDAKLLIHFFKSIQLLNESGLLLAYHDRSDGGMFVTLAEMAFAGHTGIDININADNVIDYLFNEELGAVIQIKTEHEQSVRATFVRSGIPETSIHTIGKLNQSLQLKIVNHHKNIFIESITKLQQKWASTSHQIQSLRDNPICAQQEFDSIADQSNMGLFLKTSFKLDAIPSINTKRKPRVAILREQGVNGHVEMAAAFDRAGFECIDVHMQDLIDEQIKLDLFNGLAACGGFSYGDVLGAGGGWAKTILYNDQLNKQFETFFHRKETFALGICNGCQMLSQLRDLIPGAANWPHFVRNQSEQFEARLVMVEVLKSKSILFNGMDGSKIPIVVAHGEGRVLSINTKLKNTTLRYIDHNGESTELYPFNPNGSVDGLTGFTNDDGRFTIMMPHPERVFLNKQFSWLPSYWKNEYSPWMQLFNNARKWLG